MSDKTGFTIPYSLFTEFETDLFKLGKHFRLYEKFGSHLMAIDGRQGAYFAVWAPNAKSVAVIGSFNHWKRSGYELNPRWDSSGIWEGFIPDVNRGDIYKYSIETKRGRFVERGDPFAVRWETPPMTASIVWELGYHWEDHDWMQKRKENAGKPQPYSVYEVHLGSWKRRYLEHNRSLSYHEMANELVAYVRDMGFTHVEMMPVMEHPYDPSWGYQITGFFAPTSRFGLPQEFMYLVDCFHQAGIGVLLDWVPSHFPTDAHGLGAFDGTNIYEHEDTRKGYHPDWKSLIFDYGRNEVRSFLISNALFWLDRFHADGLRVDAVASMLYLDYSRKEGEWIPNEFGGNGNLDAIAFIKEFNTTVYKEFPDVVTIAEESTAWPGVSHPVADGGLGFGQKWMMGWMHDTLKYFSYDPLFRQHHQGELTFSIIYAFSENFMLPLSHDEVVHLKASLLGKMPGNEWQRFANLRLLYGYMFTHPGTRLLFMGGEIGQYSEWNFAGSIDWHLLEYPVHSGVQTLVRDLNMLNKNYPALYHYAFSEKGFEWISYDDYQNSVIAYMRKGDTGQTPLIVICNCTPIVRDNYEIGVPKSGTWREVLNTDALKYGGTGAYAAGTIKTVKKELHGKKQALTLTLPPLATVVLELVKGGKK